MDRVALTAAVKQEARRVGFDLAGVTTPDPPPHQATYARWLQEGRHGTMAYLATERARTRRSDPRLILPSCRSILVVAMRYPLPAASPGARLAAYAVGPDYHDVLPPRLEQVMSFLRPHAAPPFEYRLYTDTGPILERELAQRAGLGWIGKNTCLIHPRQGSYFLLAEALLSEPLEPDEPVAIDHCGSCTRCLEACPTDCILPDRTLDARRCISFLTIENRGIVPLELRPMIGEWIFGCDVCQQVCPWNQRFASPDADEALSAKPDHAEPDVAAYLEGRLDLKGRATSRAGRAGMARNAAVVMGNRRLPQEAGLLRRSLLEDRHPLVRAHAAWALGEIGNAEAEEALRQAAQMETDLAVRTEIALAQSRVRSLPQSSSPSAE